MKAIQVRGAHQVSYEEIATPPIRPGEVLVRIHATGICGTDVEIVEGTMPYFTLGMAHYPIIPGHEWSGYVEAIGSGVQGFQPGDPVVGECSAGCGQCLTCLAGNYHQCPNRRETGILNLNGGFAEYIVFPANFLHKLPAALSLTTACLVEPSAIAFNGVRHTQIMPTDYVAIFGDGPIGLLTLQVARTFGAEQIAVLGATPDRLNKAKALGAALVLNVQTDDIKAELLKFGSGQLPNAIIEATGNPAAVEQAIQVIRPGGRLTMLGLFAGKRATLDLDRIVVNDITLRGRLGSPNIWPDVIRLIACGRIDPAAIISHQLPLSDFSKGIDMVRNRAAGVVKIVTNPG